jgi:hypothetical protein
VKIRVVEMMVAKDTDRTTAAVNVLLHSVSKAIKVALRRAMHHASKTTPLKAVVSVHKAIKAVVKGMATVAAVSVLQHRITAPHLPHRVVVETTAETI